MYPAFRCKKIQVGDTDRDEEPGIKQYSKVTMQAAFSMKSAGLLPGLHFLFLTIREI